MSMLQHLKKTRKNPVFLDDENDMDVDNMDFPLPNESSSSGSRSNPMAGMPNMAGMPDMAQLQKMMQSLSAGGDAQRPSAPPAAAGDLGYVSVASGPDGIPRQMNPGDYKDWVCVYPCYIDVDKSTQEGRKIAKGKAAKNPHAYHMAVACQKLGYYVVYEAKRHPRDWANVGRVRVQLKDSSNFYTNSNITSRKQLYAAIAELIPVCQKEGDVPKTIISPMTTLAEIEELADEQRKAQGLPTLAEMQAQNAAQQPQIPTKPKKQKIRYVRG